MTFIGLVLLILVDAVTDFQYLDTTLPYSTTSMFIFTMAFLLALIGDIKRAFS